MKVNLIRYELRYLPHKWMNLDKFFRQSDIYLDLKNCINQLTGLKQTCTIQTQLSLATQQACCKKKTTRTLALDAIILSSFVRVVESKVETQKMST